MSDINHIIIPYSPLAYQRELHEDTHRYRTIVAGRRVGKTTFSINELIKLAFKRNLPVPYWYIAPYYHQAKTIAWEMLLRYVPQELWARKPNETTLTVKLINGASITLKGADNPFSLEGTGLGALIVDEISAINHFNRLWEYTLRPMLSDFNAPAIFISKPRGFNHFHDLAKKGDHKGIIEGEASMGVTLDPNYITYRFTTEQNCRQHNNGYIDHAEIETAKKQMTPEAYDQEYSARFVNYSGLVHKLFNREIHLISDFIVPPEWKRVRGWDFGSAHPTASIRIAIDNDDNWFIEHSYKERDKSIEDHASFIVDQDKNDGFPYAISGYGDPSGKQWIYEFNLKGASIRPAKKVANTSEKNWIQLGIDLINGKLKSKENHIVFLPDGGKIEHAPSFFIIRRPDNMALVSELETLAYKETQQGINTAIIDDTRDKAGHYDLHAALRYAAVSENCAISYVTIPLPGNKTKEQLLIDDQAIKDKFKDPTSLREMEQQADREAIKNDPRRWG